MDPKRFLKNTVFVALAVSALLVLFNFFMDPYLVFGIPRTTGINARKPAVEDQLFLMKAYDVLRANPRTLILGSSSVGIGIDPESPVWPEPMRPVYNLGIPNGRPLEAYRYLQHVVTRNHPKTIILGLEFRDVVPYSGFIRPEYDLRLAVTQDGARNAALGRQRTYDMLHSTLSIDASVDSIDTLFGNLIGDSSDIDQGGWDHRPYRHLVYLAGAYTEMVLHDIHYSAVYSSYATNIDMEPLDHVRAILNLCREQQIDAILIMDPAHADEEDIFDLSGKWPALETWKRKITALVAEYADNGMRVELWDFYGYDAYSTESVPKNHQPLQWFMNPAHYTHALGDIMLSRMFVGGDNSFGVRLFPQNIESRLAEVRSARANYRKFQPADAARVREIYFRVTATHDG